MFGCFEGKGSSIYKGNVDKTEKVSKAIYQNNGQCSYNVHKQIDYYKIFSNHFVLKQSLINVFFIPRSIRKKVGFLIFWTFFCTQDQWATKAVDVYCTIVVVVIRNLRIEITFELLTALYSLCIR